MMRGGWVWLKKRFKNKAQEVRLDFKGLQGKTGVSGQVN